MGFFDDIKIEKDININNTIIPSGNYQSKDLCFDFDNDWTGDFYKIQEDGKIILQNKNTLLLPNGIMEIYYPSFKLRVIDGKIIEAYNMEKTDYIDLMPDDMYEDDIEWV